MTPAEKSAVLAIWTHEHFRGSRQDAWRQASGEVADTPDMFADLPHDPPAESIQADPNKMTMF